MRFMKLAFLGALTVIILLMSEMALATPSLGGISNSATGAIGTLARLMTGGAFMIAFGFGMGALVHYKAHRDNPSQVLLSKPISLLFIALAFVALAVIFLLSGNSTLGHGTLTAGVAGTTGF